MNSNSISKPAISTLALPVVFLFFELTSTAMGIRWPVNPPNCVTCSTEYRITGSFMEYRGLANSDVYDIHFHGGVDIRRPEGSPVYAVAPGRVNRLAGSVDQYGQTDSSVQIKSRCCEPFFNGDTWDYWRFLHVEDIQVFLNDSIVDDPYLYGRYCDPYTGICYYPMAEPIAYINIKHKHLHFEDVYEPEQDFLEKFNPLDTEFGILPYTDTSASVFESPDKFRLYDEFDPGEGTGGLYDTFKIRDYFDIRVHCYDRRPFGGYDPKLALYKVFYEVYDSSGTQVPGAFWEAFEFFYSERITNAFDVIRNGIEFIYDTVNSVAAPGYTTNYFYWISNNYDNYLWYDGGSSSYFNPSYYLEDEKKYRFKVYLYDIKGNVKTDQFWVRYKATGSSKKAER